MSSILAVLDVRAKLTPDVADVNIALGPIDPIPEACQTLGPFAEWHKWRPAEGAHAASSPRTPLPVKSASFWYPDGNVVIKAESVYYKLHRSRLARHSVYFQKLFSHETNEYEDRCVMVEGCPVYHVPTELGSDDFENLLAVLETPLVFTDAPPTQGIALSLLRAAHSVSCGVVFKLAKGRLCAIWDAEQPPKAPTYSAILSPSSPSSADSDTVHTYHDAVFIILFARQYGIPGLLKRAFYELLASTEFWAALTADRKQIRLTEDDLLRLYNARFVLQQRWREAVVLSPCTNEKGVSASRMDRCACYTYNITSVGRSQRWRREMLESGFVEAGTGDPMRHDVVSALTDEQRQPWCRACLKAWEDTLAEKRMGWWAKLGDLMQLT